MMISAGTYLHASAFLTGTEFENARIFIYQADENGFTGFVTNKRFERKMNELAEFSGTKALAIFDGGPVDREHLYFLHCRPELVGADKPITGNIHFGGDLRKAVALINNGQMEEKDVRIFIGYCGWDKQQLEEEIAEGSWVIGDNQAETIFQ